jgi:DNA-directed RNA polymerase specialized sigma24 family protein
LEDHDFSLAAGACTPLADIYIYQNRLEEAGKEIKEARSYILVTRQNDRLRKLFPVMSKWYSKTGNGDLAVMYMDSTLMALKSYEEKRNASQLLRSSQRGEIEKNKLAILKIQREKEHTIFIRNITIISLTFLLILLGVFFRNRNKQHKQEQLIKDLKIQEHEIELTRAKEQLTDFSRRITEKNELIEKLEKETQLQENHHLLQELKQSAILTEEDWTRFKHLYEQVYPGFFQKLRDTFPGLSPAETRYITLSKLGFNSNEAANCLGISKKSIHVTWHRMRKKLNLPETKTMQDLVAEIS